MRVGKAYVEFWDAMGRWHHKDYGMTKNPITAQRWAEELNANLISKSDAWSTVEVQYLIETLPNSNARAIAGTLERTLADVSQVIKSLNLKES